MIWVVLASLLYFVPTAIAMIRGHHNTGAIFATNLFLGWLVLGWIVALIWSVTATKPQLLTEDDGPRKWVQLTTGAGSKRNRVYSDDELQRRDEARRKRKLLIAGVAIGALILLIVGSVLQPR